jgi:hypothetical protein
VAGCTFELLARFNVANQGFANAQVLGVPEGVDAGAMTVLETDGSAEVLAQVLRLSGIVVAGWGKLSVYENGGCARTLGKTLLSSFWHITATSTAAWGWNDLAAGDTPTSWDYSIIPQGASLDVFNAGNGRTVGATLAVDTEYQFALVLGGYDVNVVPWDDTLAAASYLYGAAYFIKGGIYTDWTLLWRTVSENTVTVYPVVSLNSSAKIIEVDDLRVSGYDYSAVLQPTGKDTFADANGTSLDAHTPDVGGAWTERNGDFDIQGNRANTVNDGGAFPRALATVNGTADFFGRVLTNLAVAGDGSFLYRLSTNNDWWSASLNDAANAFRIIEVDGAVVTVRATIAVPGAAPGIDYEVTVITEGQDMQAFLDGVNRLTFASAFNQNATELGIRGQTAGTEFDNFHFQPRDGYTELDECA